MGCPCKQSAEYSIYGSFALFYSKRQRLIFDATGSLLPVSGFHTVSGEQRLLLQHWASDLTISRLA